ncbi:MAG: glycosyltransferase family 4 protein [candidate division WOR-3 bacterium]|nr:glycosyltransferase family 4 protein [candidate division WOR-3 bacterium]
MEYCEVEDKKIKVLFVTTAFPRHRDDVITPWMIELIERLMKYGIDISVFTSSYMGLKNQIYNGIPVFRFRYFFKKYERLTHEETAVDRFSRGGFNVLLSLFYIISGMIAIARLLRARKFDIVHINWPFPHILFGIMAKAVSRCKIFATFYGLEIRWLKKKFPSFIKSFSWLINRADVITAISNHTASELKGIVKKGITIIPFSITVDAQSGAVTDENFILFVGRHVERKGVNVLIEAFRKIHTEIPHNLVIVGDGPERKKWEKMSQDYGLGERVKFTGWVSKEDLHNYYKTCSFFVLPAIYDKHGDTEGLGVVMIEAMSYSKPVIASNVGGITDVVINGHNGILVKDNDSQELARAIKELACDKELYRRLSFNAKKDIDERFNWDKIVSKLIELYEANH